MYYVYRGLHRTFSGSEIFRVVKTQSTIWERKNLFLSFSGAGVGEQPPSESLGLNAGIFSGEKGSFHPCWDCPADNSTPPPPVSG